ncbi:hypothetical protein [Neobacillus kokaensis]|uniref:Sucrose phosphatase-like domain-containing protein n=1 Tax=Neobacillus kokaensis TaxID=2759023 RepID=A0ABQ3N9R1_9BACI|nr:hypothetical protein [Neobacillus kokaensis]GHH98276.1 hypothetical protein AM1BK_18190 [Neobacillus kokaensis]
MIFASDLDRTLMYSIRAMEELGWVDEYSMKPVEFKDNRWVGYMTETAFTTLKQLSQHVLFIPITTRTTAQFNRFVIFQKEIPLQYAVTTNGANILYRGKLLEEWSAHISAAMKRESLPMAEMLALLEREGFIFAGKLWHVENLFFYYTLTSLPPSFNRSMLEDFASMYGWRVSLQGRKLYFIPKAISKGAALDYICQREGISEIAGAGDSILDWDFLRNCQHRFVPKHGELANMSEMNAFTVIYRTGINAGEEILNQIVNLLPRESHFFKHKEIKTGK